MFLRKVLPCHKHTLFDAVITEPICAVINFDVNPVFSFISGLLPSPIRSVGLYRILVNPPNHNGFMHFCALALPHCSSRYRSILRKRHKGQLSVWRTSTSIGTIRTSSTGTKCRAS